VAFHDCGCISALLGTESQVQCPQGMLDWLMSLQTAQNYPQQSLAASRSMHGHPALCVSLDKGQRQSPPPPRAPFESHGPTGARGNPPLRTTWNPRLLHQRIMSQDTVCWRCPPAMGSSSGAGTRIWPAWKRCRGAGVPLQHRPAMSHAPPEAPPARRPGTPPRST